MPGATATNTAAQVPLDPSQWEEPKEKFIGRLVKCVRSTTDDAKSKDGVTFTELRGWPQAGQTLEIAVERLDAVFVNKLTGEKSPVTRYMTLDLQRYDDRQQRMVNAMQGQSKAALVLEKWTKDAHVILHPDPTKQEGLVAEWEFVRSMRVGKQVAKNLMYPVRVLAGAGKDYEYRGDVEEIEFTPSEESSETLSLDESASAQSSGSGSASKAKTATLDEAGVRALFEGVDTDNEDAVMEVYAAHKSEIPSALKAAIVGGEFFKTE